MQELHPVLQEVENFCNRNMGNRLSMDLCEVLMSKINTALMKSLSTPTSAACEAKPSIDENVN